MKVSALGGYTNAVDSTASDQSHLIFNYKANSSETPTTYKITVDNLGKAIASNLGLIKNGSDQALQTYIISSNSYGNSTIGYYLTNAQLSKLNAISAQANKANIAYDSTNKKITKTIDGTTTDVVTAATLKTDMSLNNVENKSSATIRSELTSSNVTTALGYTPLDSALKGANSGVAELDSSGKVPSSQLPSYVDDVIEGYFYNNNFYTTDAHTTTISGESGKIYVDLSGGRKVYRWGGSAFAEIPIGLALGETQSTAYRGDYGAAAYAHAVTNKGISAASGLYKITTNSEGHITAATAVEKSDITALGIPESDTTYSTGNAFISGLTKLYTSYGSGTDGAITQNALTVLMANMIVNFGLTVALPTSASITEDTTNGVLTATLSGLNDHSTIVIQKQAAGNTWTTYTEGDAWTIGDVFRVYVTRTVTIGTSTFTNSGVIGNNYTAVNSWAPSHTLTINYVYEDTTTAEESHTESITQGTAYSVNSPTITDYTPDIPVVSGTMGNTDVTVTVTYTADNTEPENNEEPQGE